MIKNGILNIKLERDAKNWCFANNWVPYSIMF